MQTTYVHVSGDKLFIDRYDGSGRFPMEATFFIVGPQYRPR
jgi:hypothetical protein